MQYVKGVDLLLRGYADYARSTSNPVPLYLAGPLDTGRYQQVVSSIVSENRLSDLVRFLGERDDVTALMSHALALIVPSRFEGFGLCMPEAMFNGCLVIAHQAYGLAEQLENGREMHGADIALSYQSVQELTQLLDEVATRGIMPFMPLIHRAHATACSLYSSEVHVENVCSFYQYIYSQSHGGA